MITQGLLLCKDGISTKLLNEHVGGLRIEVQLGHRQKHAEDERLEKASYCGGHAICLIVDEGLGI